jgi:hypothetical protein
VDEPAILFFISVALMFGAALFHALVLSKRRRKMLSAWAQEKGLNFSAGPSDELDDDYPGFQCLHTGHSRHADNLMDGNWAGRNFRAFDYEYTIGSGKSERTHELSAVILQSEVPLKPLLIRSETFLDHLGDLFGAEPIKFESAEFNHAFHVVSPDRKWAYDVLHQRAMQFLLSMPRFEIQFDGNAVLVHRMTEFTTRDFESAAQIAQGLLDELPEYVKQAAQSGA